MNVNLRSKGTLAALAIIFLAPLAGSGRRARRRRGVGSDKIAVLNVRNAIVATGGGEAGAGAPPIAICPKQNELQSTQSRSRNPSAAWRRRTHAQR